MKPLSILYATILLPVFRSGLWAQTEDLKIRQYPVRMQYPVQFSVNSNDSIIVGGVDEVRRFNSDSIFYHIATRKHFEVEDELHFYYFDILPYASNEKRDSELKK